MKLFVPEINVTKRGLEVSSFNEVTEENELWYHNIYDIIIRGRDIEDYRFIILVSFQLCKANLIERLLMMNDYHQQEDNKDKDKAWNVYGDYIEIWHDKNVKTTICSFEKKFMQDFVSIEQAKSLIATDSYFKPTCTQTAKAEFMETVTSSKNEFVNRWKFDKIFPQPEDKEFYEWKHAKEHVKAFMYLRKPGLYRNVYSYDIKSSFPAELYRSVFPQGQGRIENLPEKYWSIDKIRIERIIPIVYDFLGLFDKFLENQRQPFNVYLTKELVDALHIFYDVEYQVLSIRTYKMQKSIFDTFIESNLLFKDKPLRKYCKAKNNTFIGSFGANDEYPVYKYKLAGEYNDKVNAELQWEKKDKNAYYPVYLYVNGSALVKICRICQAYWPHIIYANTDGIISDVPLELEFGFNCKFLNVLGRVELRQQYLEFAVKDISNYSAIFADDNGEIMQDIRLSGRTILEPPTHEQFIDGGFETMVLTRSDYGFIKPVMFMEQSLKYYELVWEKELGK